MEPPSTPHPLPAALVPVADLPLRLDVAARSDPGLERESNQDSFLVVEPAAKAAWALLAVCDGMGGAAGGDVASQLAVDVLRDVMISGAAPPTRDALGRRLLLGVEEAGRRIFASARKNRQLSGMGTTATACALTGDALYIAQVGDSRAYLFREGRLSRLTRDQTLATLMMEQGQLAPEDVETCGFGHVILQAVGTAERVDVDLTRLAIAAGDVLLVCSDGLHGPVKDDAIRAILCLEPSPAAACDALIALALDAGGPDNVTVLVARVSGNALRPPSGPPSPEKARLDEDPTVGAAPIKVTVDAEETGRSPPPMDEDAALGVIARFAAFFRRRRGRRAVEG